MTATITAYRSGRGQKTLGVSSILANLNKTQEFQFKKCGFLNARRRRQ
jgi:hypothetical protein